MKHTRRTILVGLLLGGVALAAFWPVTGYDFVNYDDGVYVYRNPHVPNGLNWQNVQWAFSNLDIGLWHPLTWLSHMLDCQLYGLKRPGGHHLTNVALHAVSTVLLFLVFRITVMAEVGRDQPGLVAKDKAAKDKKRAAAQRIALISSKLKPAHPTRPSAAEGQ